MHARTQLHRAHSTFSFDLHARTHAVRKPSVCGRQHGPKTAGRSQGSNKSARTADGKQCIIQLSPGRMVAAVVILRLHRVKRSQSSYSRCCQQHQLLLCASGCCSCGLSHTSSSTVPTVPAHVAAARPFVPADPQLCSAVRVCGPAPCGTVRSAQSMKS